MLHIAEFGLHQEIISHKTMEKAILMARLLADHALVAFGVMGTDEATQDAKWIWEWINSTKQPSFTQSEVLRITRNKKLGKAERLKKALQILIQRSLISRPIKLPTRKPTTIYYISPKIIPRS